MLPEFTAACATVELRAQTESNAIVICQLRDNLIQTLWEAQREIVQNFILAIIGGALLTVSFARLRKTLGTMA